MRSRLIGEDIDLVMKYAWCVVVFFFQAEDGIRDLTVTGVQTCALPVCTCGSSVPSLVSFGRYHEAVSIIFSRSILLFFGKRYGPLKEAFEWAEHVSAVIALYDLIDIYPIYERLRRAMFQVAYVLSLCRTSISSAGDGFL